MEPVKVHEACEWTIHPWDCQPLRGEVSDMRYQVSGFVAGCLFVVAMLPFGWERRLQLGLAV